MDISWYGFNYFRVQNRQHSVIFNPYSLDKVTKFSKAKADVILFTDSTKVASAKFNDDAFIISSPGEYERSDIFVYGRQLGKKLIYSIIFDNLNLVFLGEFDHREISNEELELIEGADILILPIGGGELTTAKEANIIISQVEPRVVIPSCHAAWSFKLKVDKVDNFIKEFGVKPVETDRFKVNKKDLMVEDIKLIVLQVKK